MKLYILINSGVPREAIDLVADVEHYPPFMKGGKGYGYLTDKEAAVRIPSVHAERVSGSVVVLSPDPLPVATVERFALHPADRRTWAMMVIQHGDQENRPIILVTRPGAAMVGALTEDPSKPGGLRFTRFDAEGPSGHMEGTDPIELLKNAYSDGFRVLAHSSAVNEIMGLVG